MKIGIIGGGAAGMMAAVRASELGADVTLFEQNEKTGKKLFITGKGRCNFTNDCDEQTLFANVVTNPKFLYSAFGQWNSQQSIGFFEDAGVKTKVERGSRAFPASDHSSDIIRALDRKMKENGVRVMLRTKVTGLITEDIPHEKKGPVKKITGLLTEDAGGGRTSTDGSSLPGKQRHEYDFDRVLIATGGLSYATTGSTGDGFRFAEKEGLAVTSPRPALVPLVTEESYIPELQGLSLRNVRLTIPYGKKKTWSGFGEMLFTHFGISGPLVLSASSVIAGALEEGPLKAVIDLKPALTDEQLDARLLREFGAAQNREFKNAVAPLFPAKLRPVMIRLSGIDGDKPVNAVTKQERQAFIRLIRAFPMTITGTRGFGEAIITQGGVSVKEINPSTMASRKIAGLCFAGEVIDTDALTGGFNLQIAWATARLAAEHMTEE